MARRRKMSATVAPGNYAYPQRLVKRGDARNISEAVDIAVQRVRRIESRARLERDAAAYFESLSGKARAEEARLAAVLSEGLDEIDFEK